MNSWTRLDADLQEIEFFWERRIRSPIPGIADGRPAPLGLGTFIVLEGDRDATRDLALDIVQRALGAKRPALVVAPLERRTHVRLRTLFTPYVASARDFGVDRPVPSNAVRARRDLDEVLDHLLLTVVGLDDDPEDALVGRIRDTSVLPLDVIALLDADAAPVLVDRLTGAAVHDSWVADALPVRVCQMARTLRSVIVVTLASDDPETARRWARVADDWLHVDRAPGALAGEELRITRRGGARSLPWDQRLDGEAEPPDAEGADNMWSAEARDARYWARLEREAIRAQLPLSADGEWTSSMFRLSFSVHSLQRKMTKNGDMWAELTFVEGGVEHEVLVFPGVFAPVGHFLVEGAAVEVIASLSTSRLTEFHALKVELADVDRPD